MKLAILIASLAALAAASSAATPPRQDQSRDMSEADRAACLQRGGFTAHYGMLGLEGCYFRYADAGKRCTGSNDCKGRCIHQGSDAYEDRPKPGRTAIGRCEATSAQFGCYTLVEHGRSRGRMCVD